MTVAAIGRTRMLFESVRALVAHGHDVPFIGTCRAAPEYDVTERDFSRLAAELGATFVETQDINAPDVVEALERSGAEAAISVNWIGLVREAVCGAFRHGVLNAHAGDLPRYRGNAPVAWAMLDGEAQVGVTVHQMDPGSLDSGPIVAKAYIPLTGTTYIGDVQAALDRLVPRLFVEAVRGLEDGTIRPVPQPADPALALHGFPRRPEDGRLVWSRPADLLARLVRCSAEPYAGAFATLDGAPYRVWRARAEGWPVPYRAVPGQVMRRDAAGHLWVATGEGVLVVEEGETAAGGRRRAAEHVRSLRARFE